MRGKMTLCLRLSLGLAMNDSNDPVPPVLASRLDAAAYVIRLHKDRVDRRTIQAIARGLGIHSNASIGGILRLIYEELKEE